MTGNDEKTSAYNEGLLQIQRLHYLWSQANNQSRTGEYLKWRWTLDAIWRELSRDAIKNKGHPKAEDFTKINEKNEWFKQYGRLDQAIEEVGGARIPTRNAYTRLRDLEVFLRTLQDVVGKGGKYRDLDEDDID